MSDSELVTYPGVSVWGDDAAFKAMVQGIYRRGLEAAAKACDERAEAEDLCGEPCSGYMKQSADRCAAAIRALLAAPVAAAE